MGTRPPPARGGGGVGEGGGGGGGVFQREEAPRAEGQGEEKKTEEEASARGGGLRPRTPSEGREVRCACQYFQTDSLLPERSALAALWKHQRPMGDHEYEPVAAPPPRPAPPPIFLGWEADEDPEELKRRLETAGVGEKEDLEREFLHSGLDDDPGAPPVDGAREEEAMMEIQGTPPSPSPPSLSRTPTTESRTDCELTTSQVESSGLEELPLRRGARREAQRGPGPLATSIKRKIRNQAGRLRTKMRSIPRPTFRVPEGLMRVGKGAPTSKDSASSAADTMERPLRVEKKRTAAQLFDFRTYPRIFERKLKPRGEFFSKRASSSGNEDNTGGLGASAAPPRRKVPFGTRWAHRFSDIRYADEEEAAGSPARENDSTSSLRGSAPEGSWSGGSAGQELGGEHGGTEGRPGVLEEIDADEFFLREKGLSRDDLRRGEEISSEIRDALRPPADEVAVRRGDSAGEEEEEEVEGEEEEEEEEEEELMVEVEMTPPQRPSRRSTPSTRQQRVIIDEGFMTFPPQRPKRRKGMIVQAGEIEGMIPSETGEEEEAMEPPWKKERDIVVNGAIMAENLVRDEWEEGWGRKEEEERMIAGEIEEKVLHEGVMAEGGREMMGDHRRVVEGREDEEEEVVEVEEEGGWGGYVGDRLRGWLGGGGEGLEEGMMEGEVEESAAEMAPPMPPKRRRRAPFENSAVSLEESRGMSSEEVRMEEFNHSSTNVSLKQQLSDSAQIFPTQITMDTALTSPIPEYASPLRDLTPPVAPRRTRSLPRRPKEREESSPIPPRISISVPPRPHRRTKVAQFFTVPRRKAKKLESPPPRRPARSGYATPGPPKPPQRRRPSTPPPTSIPPSEDLGIESAEERVKELTAGEVVSKMRGRPLPPPPRPPRRERTRSAERSPWEEVVQGHLTLGSDRAPESITSAKSLSDAGRIPPEEVSIAIQTDPLPYEYCMEDGALEEGAPPTSSEHTSDITGRRSPMTWPTPPPTPPPTAKRQRRQAASRRAAAAAAASHEAAHADKLPEVEQPVSMAEEIILAGESPPTVPSESPPVERRLPTPLEDVPAAPLPASPQERLSEDAPPSIPPLPAVILSRECPPPEETPIPAASPQEPPVPESVSSPLPPPVPPAPSAETEPSVQETERPVLVTEEPPIRPSTPTKPVEAVPVAQKPSPVVVLAQESKTHAEPQLGMPPIAPPRPPKPIPKPAEPKPPPTPAPTAAEPPTSDTKAHEPSHQTVPPPSFAQLRSPETEDRQPAPQQYPYSIPPPFFFHPQSSPEELQGRTMPPAPQMAAVALLCVGEISARKLVVSEFQTSWGGTPGESREPLSQQPPPPEQQQQQQQPPRRRSTSRGSSEWTGRRRVPSVPTARRRPPPRRSQSESSGSKEGKGDYTEDPEDPDLPGIGELSGRLARACGNAAVSTVRQLLLTAVERVEGDGRTEAAIIIALVMAVALVVLTMGHTRQGHRWDFYLPPAP